MISWLLKLLKNKLVIAGIAIFLVYQLFFILMTLPYRNNLGAVNSKEKITLVLNEFLKPDNQINLMRESLNLQIPGMLYEVAVNDTIYKRKGIVLETPTEPSEILKILPYRNLEEFRLINPDCCTTKIVKDRDSCFDRSPTDGTLNIRHGYYMCVFIKYKLRYLDEEGQLVERASNNDLAVMLNKQDKIVQWEPY